MICVYCNYKTGWCPDIMDSIDGEHGSFYRISNDIHMFHSISFGQAYQHERNKLELVGCPACNKIFMADI